jgi:diguanylate cyclase (GGDEF)-like protein
MTNDFSILYIEDDRLTQRIIVSVLEKYFTKIFIANDGVEGIKLYHEKRPDIILSDISMPNLNGIAMIEKIKQHNPKQKIVLFTGYNDLDYLKKAINIGVDKYILKPLETQEMLRVLNEIMQSLREEKEEEAYKKRLEFIAQHDELTSLFTRRQFFFLLEKLCHHSEREKKVVAVLALDLNKFKPINDTYGHEVGDLVLKRVAKNLLSSIKKEDIVARFGGDEFGIGIGFLNEKSEVLKILESIEKSLKKPLLYVDEEGIEHEIDITCSIGITFYVPQDDRLPDLKRLMREADRAMYRAKKLNKPYIFFK